MPQSTDNREYLIIATEAGYSVYVETDGQRYPLGVRPYQSISRARDQIPKRFRNRARLVHHTPYTEMINTPQDTSPATEFPEPDSRTATSGR